MIRERKLGAVGCNGFGFTYVMPNNQPAPSTLCLSNSSSPTFDFSNPLIIALAGALVGALTIPKATETKVIASAAVAAAWYWAGHFSL